MRAGVARMSPEPGPRAGARVSADAGGGTRHGRPRGDSGRGALIHAGAVLRYGGWNIRVAAMLAVMPEFSSASVSRRRSSRAIAPCPSAVVLATVRITAPSTVTCSTPTTSGGSTSEGDEFRVHRDRVAAVGSTAIASSVPGEADRHVDDDHRPPLALVADPDDLTVADVPEHPGRRGRS